MGLKSWISTLVALLMLLMFGSTPAANAATSSATMFNAASGNQQGLATDGHYVWVSYDVGGGLAKIVTYRWTGTYIGTSKALPLGHAAELDFRVKDHSLYVANGGLQTEATGADTKVFRVSLVNNVASAITKTYDFAWLGHNGMVAVDNATDHLIAIGGPDAGPWTVTIHEFGHASRSTALSTFTVGDPGVLLQGLAVVHGSLWLYVSQGTQNRIDVFNTCGTLKYQVKLPFTGEAEGLAVNPLTGSIYVGAHSPNRVLRVSGV